MPLYTKQLPGGLSEVDVIIAGGGTAACVVAARLSDALPDLSILVIEGGQNNANDPLINFPGYFLANLAPGSTANILYKTNKADELNGRELMIPSGGILGGGSSTNFMMYSRPLKSDFDSWNAPGWSAEDILPYLKKLETYHGPDEKGVHGQGGPVHVSRGTYTPGRLEDEFITAASKLAGWEAVPDAQDLETVNGAGRLRQDAATCHLHPLLNDNSHPNLHVLVEAQVTRILFDDDKTANAVEFRPNPLFVVADSASAPATATTTIKARKLVIASCGAIGTPVLLQRSGVGSPSVLEKANVPLVSSSPGVGASYLDHNMILYPYLNSLSPADTLDALVYGRMGPPPSLIAEQHPMLGWNGQELPPSSSSRAKPDVILTALAGFPLDPSLNPSPGDPGLGCSAFIPYPSSCVSGSNSKGHVYITGPGIDSPLDFSTGFLSSPDDLALLCWTYKTQRELMRRMPSYRGEVAACHPPFAADSPAACVSLSDVDKVDISSVESMISYTEADDAVLEKWIRDNVGSGWHSMGTCKMGASSSESENKGRVPAVVDFDLNVYGVNRLKLVDLSVVPGNVRCNTASVALAVGEKAADIIIKELGEL
ncbi:alcohol oxidase [Rhypophila sp. PSN 637]